MTWKDAPAALWTFLLLRRSMLGWGLIVAVYSLTAIALITVTVWPWDAALAVNIVLVLASLAALVTPSTRIRVGVSEADQPPSDLSTTSRAR